LDRKRSKSLGLIEESTETMKSDRWLYSLRVERFARLVDVLQEELRTTWYFA
jgi:hypothetical protein